MQINTHEQSKIQNSKFIADGRRVLLCKWTMTRDLFVFLWLLLFLSLNSEKVTLIAMISRCVRCAMNESGGFLSTLLETLSVSTVMCGCENHSVPIAFRNQACASLFPDIRGTERELAHT